MSDDRDHDERPRSVQTPSVQALKESFEQHLTDVLPYGGVSPTYAGNLLFRGRGVGELFRE